MFDDVVHVVLGLVKLGKLKYFYSNLQGRQFSRIRALFSKNLSRITPFTFSIHWASLIFIFCLRWPLGDILKSKQEDDISWRIPRPTLGREIDKNAKSPDFYGQYLVRKRSWPRLREFKNFITTMLGTRYLANSGKIEGNWSFCWLWFTKMA